MRAVVWLYPTLLCAQAPLRLERTIPLPGVEGRIDHLAADIAGRRVFVAALGNGSVEVLDVNAGRRVRSLGGLKEPQGLAYVADLRRLYVAGGGDGTLRIYDGATLEPQATVPLGDDADNLRFDPVRRVLWVGYGDGALGAFDVAAGKRTGDIRLANHPESFQLEKGGARIWVNVPKAGQVAVVDRDRRTVTARWPVGAGVQNFPMALDEAHGRLLVACRKPARVLVLDIASGRRVAEFGCVGDADDMFYDSALQRLYVVGGEGAVDVFEGQAAGDWRAVAKVATGAGARTALLVPEWSLLLVAVPHRGAQPAAVQVFSTSSADKHSGE